MNGLKDLHLLLGGMNPLLEDTPYVFCSCKESINHILAEIKPLGLFCEEEGVTVMLTESDAINLNLSYSSVMQKITLKVHSSLEAVGLTAAVATELAHEGISANVVAAYYHDHIFVPQKDAKRAVEVLQNLQHLYTKK